MYSLIAFATQWGSKHGGINSFNTDFLTAFGVAYHLSAQVICIVSSATSEEIEDARNAHVILLPLPYQPKDQLFTSALAQVGIDELKRRDVSFNPNHTVWLGHDRITGGAANAAVEIAGGRSALIHHMSYDHYESYAEDSRTAYEKTEEQTTLFQHADLVLAIGPLLRDALSDRLHEPKNVHMLVPGLADIETREPPRTFTAFLGGRFRAETARIKQAYLGVAAFAKSHHEARGNGMPDGLCKSPKLVLRGVDFETHLGQISTQPQAANPEVELKKFAEQYAQGVINLHALPYAHDRRKLYADLSAASVVLMPSWHEGFGLVAWEAIAAGVPVIISKNSGVYRLLEEVPPASSCVHAIEIAGAVEYPFFRNEDLECVVAELKKVANDINKARRQAGILKSLLGEYTWSACAEEAARIFEWPLQKGSIPASLSTQAATILSASAIPITQPVPPTPGSPLHIPLKQWRAGGVLADSQLLRAEEAMVPFDPARQPELDALNTWLDDTRWPQAVRLITGAGGLGKTRLALELCQQRLVSSWHAGFLDTDHDAKNMATSWHILRSLNQPLLIVIDYAETRQTTILALIKAMVQAPCDQPMRLLLLARDGGEWWDNLPGKDPTCEPLLSGYATSGPFCLPPLHEAEQDRQHAYQEALRTFAQVIETTEPNVVPDLSAEHFGRPLYLQMAALLALHGERLVTAQGLTKALLNHERRYWRRLFPNSTLIEPERYAELLLALATLTGGFATPKFARLYWERAIGNIISSVNFNLLFHTLAPLYPGKQGLQAVRPDLLGEALVAQALLRPEATGLLDAVLTNSASQPIRRNALTVLARLSAQYNELHETLVEALVGHFAQSYQDIVAVATVAQSHLPVLAEKAFARLPLATKSTIAALLESQLGEESVQLAELACLVSKYLLDKRHQKHLKKPGDIEFMADYATALRNHAVSLMRIGRNDNACSHAHESSQVFERLVTANADRYLRGYAGALNVYATNLSGVGHYDDALKHAKQALEILKGLVQVKADLYEDDYAGALSNYANRLNDVGQYDEALKHAGQVLGIRQRLVEKNPVRYEPDHATALSNYAGHLSDAGQYDEALKHAKHALEIRQQLVRSNADRHVPDYATSLSNYAGHLADVGQHDEALKHAHQALEIRQQLVQKNPDRYTPDYATSLGNYSNHLGEVGQHDEALKHARQALKICHGLMGSNADRFVPDYALTLSNYARRLSEAGQYSEAFIHAGQALEIRQQLVRKNPDRFEPDYALTLSSYANHLSDAGRYNEAHTNEKQAMEIYKRLVEQKPARFSKNLFITICSVHFFGWLASKSADLTDLSFIPTTIPPHLRSISLLQQAFVQACWASDQTARAGAFKQVIGSFHTLSLSNKVITQACWLCAVAWCATFDPTAVKNLDWRSSFHHFANQRQGQLPHWMQELAQRMNFEWPAQII